MILKIQKRTSSRPGVRNRLKLTLISNKITMAFNPFKIKRSGTLVRMITAASAMVPNKISPYIICHKKGQNKHHCPEKLWFLDPDGGSVIPPDNIVLKLYLSAFLYLPLSLFIPQCKNRLFCFCHCGNIIINIQSLFFQIMDQIRYLGCCQTNGF